MKVLITGGAGYIGSHVAHFLAEGGTEIVVLDNLYSGVRAALPKGVPLIEGDVGNRALLKEVFSQRQFNAVLHFAAHIEVGESVADPAKYYRNNTIASLTLFEAAREAGVGKFIFSSTAAVYGEPSSNAPLGEDSPLRPMNPYGASKMMAERMLQDIANASRDEFRFIILRYFNAAGARRDLKVGQATPRATHLIKIAAETALGRRDELVVHGNDYPTPDGTCQRDYIHVEDLAQAHADALAYLDRGGASEILNVGYGQARSVIEVIEAMERVSGKKLPHRIGPRRSGDPSVVLADGEKLRRMFGWKPQFTDLDLICKTAFEWERKLQELKWK